MALIVDASVAVKWFVQEAGHDDARRIFERRIRRSAPELVLIEVANAIRNKVRLGQMSEEQADQALGILPNCFVDLVPSVVLLESAYRLGTALNHPVSDCMYLACAEHTGGFVVSADERFVAKCQKNGVKQIFDLSSRDWLSEIRPDLEVSESTYKDVSRLARIVADTFAALQPPPGEPAGGLKSIRQPGGGNMLLGYETPAYRLLTKTLLALPEREVAILLALGWLGKDRYRAERWSEALANADNLVSGGMKKDIPYIVAQLTHVERGRDKLIASAQIVNP